MNKARRLKESSGLKWKDSTKAINTVELAQSKEAGPTKITVSLQRQGWPIVETSSAMDIFRSIVWK